MNSRKYVWLCFALAIVFVATTVAGCGMTNRPNRSVTPAPAPTRTPDGNLGVSDYRANDNRNLNRNFGMNRARPSNTMRLADDVADKVADMREVKSATVMLMGNTAYVAVDMPAREQGRLTNRLKDRIGDVVRRADSRIDNVYVSADADFFQRMGGYARDIRGGKPIRGMVNEITETFRRTFPTAH
ncbi:YhcN/YlaJ family sporulation lipoprotein [Numidum massiliense]|uniref:YhcN/YlaJ family sporulation lipoprotein n=1 Tax=Numidum massiliense TaxID=1522315 RepID=UPI0006D5A0DD|nr:YhcN/YlaJ family sporulation lipoprotein [Numidum massiliense]